MILLNKAITSGNSSNPLRKVFTFFLTIAMFALILMFSAVFFAVVAVLGFIAWGYLWWKTRSLRKQMQAKMQGKSNEPFENAFYKDNSYQNQRDEGMTSERTSSGGTIIEGEVIRVAESDSGNLR